MNATGCAALSTAAPREAFMNITRRTLLGTVAASLSAIPAFKASAQADWPSRVVRLVSPYGAGGASDISLRILAEQFARTFNQQFIVENKPGAGTRVANELVSRAAPLRFYKFLGSDVQV